MLVSTCTAVAAEAQTQQQERRAPQLIVSESVAPRYFLAPTWRRLGCGIFSDISSVYVTRLSPARGDTVSLTMRARRLEAGGESSPIRRSDADNNPYEMEPDEVWHRIDAALKRRRKNWTWLGQQLGHSSRAVCGNWKRRGVPTSEHEPIAAALGQSIDWLVGISDDDGKPEPVQLSAMALRIAQEFDALDDDAQQLDAYTQIIGVIVRARGV